MTYFLDLRADAVGGIPARDVTVKDNQVVIDKDVLNQAVSGRDVLIGTHGFNVNRAAGVSSLSGWEPLLTLGSDAVFVAVLWPGDSKWIPVLDYPLEGDEAIKSGKLLAKFLSANLEEAASLSFASHSLGARTVLETIKHLTRPVRRLTLMAGAIEDKCLTKEYADAAKKVDSISILASKGDTVLQWAFPAGNLAREIIKWKHPHWSAAIGRAGPTPPYPGNLQFGWQIPDDWKYGHGDYLMRRDPIGPAIAPPVTNPPNGNAPPGSPVHWEPAWSAGYVSTRFR